MGSKGGWQNWSVFILLWDYEIGLRWRIQLSLDLFIIPNLTEVWAAWVKNILQYSGKMEGEALSGADGGRHWIV